MSVDFTKMKKDDEITLKDGRKGHVKSVYLGTEGIMVIVKTGIAGPCDQNFLLADVAEHKEKGL